MIDRRNLPHRSPSARGPCAVATRDTSGVGLFAHCVCASLVLLSFTRFALPAMADVDTVRLAAETRRGMELWHVPGMAVAVVSGEDVLMRAGFGVTAASNGRPVTEHTLFAIASTTKAMVVAGILMLVDEGSLKLDDPVIAHIPELHFASPLVTEQIMVRDLLAHRTGLPSTDFWAFFQNMPLDRQIERLRSVTPEAPVRTRLIYQNTMFELAGLLIERTSGQSWDAFLAERLWLPLDMLETVAARSRIDAAQNHVLPHYYFDEKLIQAEWDLPADVADAAGSVWSSIHDMSLWAQFLLRGGTTEGGERLVSEDLFAEMFEPQQLASSDDFYPTVELTRPNWRTYALGWFQQDFQGRMIDFHTGSLNGLIAIIGLDRANDRAVVVLGNRDHAEMRHALLWEVMDGRAGSERRDWNQDVFDLYARLAEESEQEWQETRRNRLENTRPGRPVDDYAGIYRSARNGDILIRSDGRRLALDTELIDLELDHWQLDTFLAEYGPWRFREFATFQVGTDGGVNAVELFGDVFTRVPDAPQGPRDSTPAVVETIVPANLTRTPR